MTVHDDRIKFYNIEAEHLADLKKVARRLLNARPDTESRMSGEELRDAAVTIMCVVNYAEVLDTFKKPGSAIQVNEHVFPELFKEDDK